MGITHTKVTVIADDPNYDVGADEWNDDHVVTASDIPIVDTGSLITATEVEGALAELDGDLTTHAAAADPHTGYRLESVRVLESYSLVVQNMRPLAYWRLNESTGTILYDRLGGYNGTYLNTPTLGVAGPLTGDPTTAVTFTAASSEAGEIPDTAPLHPGDTFSVNLWLKRVATGVDAHMFSNVVADDIQMWIWGGNDKLYLSKYAGAHAYTSTLAISDTNWHMLTITKAGATVAGYIDGTASANLAGGATIVAGSGLTKIGEGTGFTNGSMAEVAVWNRALSAAEVLTLYNVGTGA